MSRAQALGHPWRQDSRGELPRVKLSCFEAIKGYYYIGQMMSATYSQLFFNGVANGFLLDFAFSVNTSLFAKRRFNLSRTPLKITAYYIQKLYTNQRTRIGIDKNFGVNTTLIENTICY